MMKTGVFRHLGVGSFADTLEAFDVHKLLTAKFAKGKRKDRKENRKSTMNDAVQAN
jgi:hypothetical protein